MKCIQCGGRMVRLLRHIFDPMWLVWACERGDSVYGKWPTKGAR